MNAFAGHFREQLCQFDFHSQVPGHAERLTIGRTVENFGDLHEAL